MCVCVHTDRPNIYVNIHTHTPTFCIVRHPYNIQPYVRTYINTHTHTHTHTYTTGETHTAEDSKVDSLGLGTSTQVDFLFFFPGGKINLFTTPFKMA